MLKVAFCDDDLQEIRALSALMDQYRVDKNMEIAYTAFQSPLELVNDVEKGLVFDAIFLDVLMPGENGIEAAQEIRKLDKSTKIIFLTSSAEFAVQSYGVNAYFYKMKPIGKDAFYQLMDRICGEKLRDHTDFLIMKCKTGITKINLLQLEYCEVINRSLHFHFANGKVLESMGKMQDIAEGLMQRGNFLRPHRSYLVNMDYIHQFSYQKITMYSSAQIPIPHGKFEELKKLFLDYSFQEETENQIRLVPKIAQKCSK